eukprot:TRINITY_DN1095_c1_g1_i1.p1 TRINITY_DN1095_c1_g1~~TRINITY_DN1095_c1_g1_i1.p1  ORF type:complete len:1178 (+),score=540.13 TRINITY_DN1095_c1_g1_i1:108-3641(+)
MGKKKGRNPLPEDPEEAEKQRTGMLAELLEEEDKKPKPAPKGKKGKKGKQSHADYMAMLAENDEDEEEKPKETKAEATDSEEDGDMSDEVQKPVKPQAKRGKKGRRASLSSDDDVPVAAAPTLMKTGRKGKRGQDDSDDEPTKPQRGGKKNKAKNKRGGKAYDDDDDEDDVPAALMKTGKKGNRGKGGDSDDDEPTVPQRGGKKNKAKNKRGGKANDDDDEDDVDPLAGPGKKGNDSDDEPTMPQRGGKNKKKNKRGGRGGADDDEDEEEKAAEKPEPAQQKGNKGKKNKKMSNADYMSMMVGDDEEDEEEKKRVEEEKKKKEEEEKAAEAKKKAEEEAKKKAEEEAKKKAEEEAKRKAEEEAKRKAEEEAKKAEEEAARKAEEEEARLAAEEEAKKKAAAEANKKADEEDKKLKKQKEAAARNEERRKKKEAKLGVKPEEQDKADDDDDEPRMLDADDLPTKTDDKVEKKLTKKEMKALEKKRLHEAKLAEAAKEGKNGAFTDSPFSVQMPEDAWKVEDNSRDIKIEQVSIAVSAKQLFVNTTVKVTCGHRYGLIGPNGRGKSTVLRLLSSGELPIPKKLHVLLVEQEQEVDETVMGEKVVNVVINSHKKRIAMMEEADKLRESGDDLERLQELEDDLEAMGAFQAEAKARKILGGLGFLSEWQDRKVSSFSGGWRKRVALACAVFMEPDVLLLDEPTNHLDLNAVIWLETYLPSVYNENKKKPKSLVVVSHDVSFLEEVCTDTVHIEELKLNYYRGNYERFLVQLQQHHKVMDKEAKLVKDYTRELKSKGNSKEQVKEKLEERAKKKGWDKENMPKKRQEYNVTFPWEPPPELREGFIVKSEQMQFRYRDDLPWIFGGPENKKGVDFSVWTDSRIALVGPNGCGKTTLIQLLESNITPVEGVIEVNRQVRVGRYSQHFVDQLPLSETAVDYLVTCGVGSEFKARAKLGAFGLEGKAHLQEINTLSGGQKVRVAFAGISAAVPHALLLDEPTNHLDMESIQALADSLKEFAGGVLVITHDARLIRTLDATLWVVQDHNVVKFDGDLDDYKDHLVKLLDLEQERKDLAEEKKRELKKIRQEEAFKSREQLAKEESSKSKKRAKEQAEIDARERAEELSRSEALESFMGEKDAKKKDKKDKKDKEDKKEKKEKKDKKDKEDKKEKKEKKEKKDKKDKK